MYIILLSYFNAIALALNPIRTGVVKTMHLHYSTHHRLLIPRDRHDPDL
jgi:hypothetical protein